MRESILNGAFIVAPSKIKGAGLGLFCGAKAIPKGKNLFIAFGRADFSNEFKNVKTFEQHFIQLYPNNFVNHSETPNTTNVWVGELYIVKKALRDILPGEELFSNYDRGMRIVRAKGYDVNNWLSFRNGTNK